MPVDYSKWDALEVSDDSDIEVHPNVDKRSFIRAKQHQIHQERLERKNRIEGLKFERALNDGLLRRISALLASLRAHAFEAETRNPGEVAFLAVMESAGHPEEDQPPPRPECVYSENKEPPPTYSKMMTALLDQVNKSLDEKKPDDRYSAMIEEVQVHESKVKELQKNLAVELEKLLQEEMKRITSEDIHVGFDNSHVNKASASGTKGSSTGMELLNPEHGTTLSGTSADVAAGSGDEDMQASPDAQEFARIQVKEYATSLQFLSEHPHILKESDTDGILVMAFDAALERKYDFSQQCVHQALLLQYCRALGRDGVALFFKRITTKGHKAQEVFYNDVRDTYGRIKKRSQEILAERAKEPQGGVEQIQLHALEPGTRIQISVPPADSVDEGAQAARRTYEGFTAEMRAALDAGELDAVNKVLAKMTVEEAEEVVRLLGEANILSMEEQIIDATTEEGKQQLKEMEASQGEEGEGGGRTSMSGRIAQGERGRCLPSTMSSAE